MIEFNNLGIGKYNKSKIFKEDICNAATAQFVEDFGASIGDPYARGTSRTSGVTQCNWKSAGDVSTSYSSAPVTAGENSFDKFQFVVLSGTFNEVKSGFWQHTYNANHAQLGAGLSILCRSSGSGFYRTPAQTANANLIHNLTSTGAIATGLTVRLGQGADPQVSGFGIASSGIMIGNMVTACTEYLGSQLQTQSSAAAGDLSSTTWTFQWTEN